MVVESTASAQNVPHFHIYLPLLLWTLGTLLVVGYLLLYCHQNTLSWRTIINLCMKRKWTSLILWSPNYMDGTIFAWGLKSLSSNIWPLTLTIDINIGQFFCFWTNTTQVFATSSLSLTHIYSKCTLTQRLAHLKLFPCRLLTFHLDSLHIYKIDKIWLCHIC